MKDLLTGTLAVGLLCLVYFLNTKIPGAVLWKGTRIQPRFSDRFPIVPTTDSQKERRRPALWLWNLVQLLAIVMFLIWFLKSRGR
jgi:hypothetical protein